MATTTVIPNAVGIRHPLEPQTVEEMEKAIEILRAVPDVQPAIMLDEFLECEQACEASHEWQEALRKRGIADFDLCIVDPWSAGKFGLESENGRRLAHTLTWIRSLPDDNGYARPVENVDTIVDLHAMKVIPVEDCGVAPLRPEEANYSITRSGRTTWSARKTGQ